MKLQSRSRQKLLMQDIRVASRFFDRGRGLLGISHLGEEQGLWINPCNNIHTFFMRFSIDCVFVDCEMKVQSLYENVGPWKVIFPKWSARSVFELPAGSIQRLQIQIGEVLDVGT